MFGYGGFSLLGGGAMLMALALCRPSSGMRIVVFTLMLCLLAMVGMGASMKHLLGVVG